MIKGKNAWLKNENGFISNQLNWMIQLIYWFIHFGLLVLLFCLKPESSLTDAFIWLMVTGPFILVIFYSHFYFIVPRFLGKANWKFILICVTYFIIYPPLKYFIDLQLDIDSLASLHLGAEKNTADFEFYNKIQELGRRLFTILWNVPFALFARFSVDWFKNMRIKSKMETQQLKSELSMLRNQVNPHFLFNVLNNIDSMVYPHSQEASNAIMKLSAIMRYMLYESNVEYVPIKKEIEYLNAYIELQKMRLKEVDKISFSIDDSFEHIKIAPMILIPFVENASKHAARINQQIKINILLSFKNNQLKFIVENSHDVQIQEHKDGVGGIGYSNVRKRLELIYPGQHSLNIINQNDSYIVHLDINY